MACEEKMGAEFDLVLSLEAFEVRGAVSGGDGVVEVAGCACEEPGNIRIVDCHIEGELRVPPGYRFVHVVRSSIGRLVVDAAGVAGVCAHDGAIDEVVLGSEALEEVEVVRCGLRRISVVPAARLGRLLLLDLRQNRLERYDVAASATPRLGRLELGDNAPKLAGVHARGAHTASFGGGRRHPRERPVAGLTVSHANAHGVDQRSRAEWSPSTARRQPLGSAASEPRACGPADARKASRLWQQQGLRCTRTRGSPKTFKTGLAVAHVASCVAAKAAALC
jgi:hypothetical protein